MSAESNVTVHPLAQAIPVDDPEIAEVIDLDSGQLLDAKRFIADYRYDHLVVDRGNMREALKRDEPLHACAICWTPVYLVASPQKRFFFRHCDVEDGSCPAITRTLTEEEIRIRKYHGLRESEAHKRIKRLIERSLKADPAFHTETIQTEKNWRSESDPKKWRRPDVQASTANRRFAFEAQLSTTFLDVVIERKMFYRGEGAQLVWILADFSPEYRRMTTDDLFFSNNSNIFVVDEETTRVSEERKRFHLRCHFRSPYPEEGMVSNTWETALVPFDELTQDTEGQRIFHFDYEAAERRVWARIDQDVRDAVVAFWSADGDDRFMQHPDQIFEWKELHEKLAERDAPVPHYPQRNASFRSMMLAVLSGLTGRPVGWQFDTLIQCAHQIAEVHPENLLAFGYAVKLGGHEQQLRDEDTTGKWEKRCRVNRARLRAGDPALLPPAEWMPALEFLFPEVGKQVREFLERT